MAAPNTDIVALLLIIEDIIHNKVEQVQGAMGLVESNMIVYTTTLDLKDTLNEYYWAFKAQFDTLKAPGNNPGYHGTLYWEHCNTYVKDEGYGTEETLATVPDTV